MRKVVGALVAGGMLVVVSPLLAHHEWPVDRTRQITIQGVVAGFHWANPHVMIDLDIEANGTVDKWRVGGSSPQFMTTCGWTKNTLKPGDVITVIAYPYKDGSHTAQMQRVLLMPSGKEMYYGAPPLQQAQCAPRN